MLCAKATDETIGTNRNPQANIPQGAGLPVVGLSQASYWLRIDNLFFHTFLKKEVKHVVYAYVCVCCGFVPVWILWIIRKDQGSGGLGKKQQRSVQNRLCLGVGIAKRTHPSALSTKRRTTTAKTSYSLFFVRVKRRFSSTPPVLSKQDRGVSHFKKISLGSILGAVKWAVWVFHRRGGCTCILRGNRLRPNTGPNSAATRSAQRAHPGCFRSARKSCVLGKARPPSKPSCSILRALRDRRTSPLGRRCFPYKTHRYL